MSIDIVRGLRNAFWVRSVKAKFQRKEKTVGLIIIGVVESSHRTRQISLYYIRLLMRLAATMVFVVVISLRPMGLAQILKPQGTVARWWL